MAQSAPSVVFGAAGMASLSTEDGKEILNILEKHNVNQLDTASVYVSPCSLEEFNGGV
jgi:aflatoxin B1 aldehyde reductase